MCGKVPWMVFLRAGKPACPAVCAILLGVALAGCDCHQESKKNREYISQPGRSHNPLKDEPGWGPRSKEERDQMVQRLEAIRDAFAKAKDAKDESVAIDRLIELCNASWQTNGLGFSLPLRDHKDQYISPEAAYRWTALPPDGLFATFQLAWANNGNVEVLTEFRHRLISITNLRDLIDRQF